MVLRSLGQSIRKTLGVPLRAKVGLWRGRRSDGTAAENLLGKVGGFGDDARGSCSLMGDGASACCQCPWLGMLRVV